MVGDKVGEDAIMEEYGEGLWVFEKDCLYGYADENFNIVIDAQFDWAAPFHEGFAQVMINDEGHFFIDKKGNNAFGVVFTDNEYFSEGLAAVATGDYDDTDDDSDNWSCKNWGFINTKGEMVIAPIYDKAEPFSSGMAAVRVGKKWGYIDKSGKMVIEPQFGSANEFNGDCAKVEAFIDKQGNVHF